MPATFATVVRFCATCRADVPFEQPSCGDDHGADCPEWVCVECGDAVLVGFLVDGPVSATSADARRVA